MFGLKFFVSIALIAMPWIVTTSLHAQEQPDNPQKLSSLFIPIEGLLVGGQPSVEDLGKIKALGFNTIISLRPELEEESEVGYNEQSEAAKLGFEFIRIPITDADDLNNKNLSALDMAIEKANGGAFLHCRTGNRVGAMLALRAFRMQQRSYADALALGKNSGMTWLTESVEKLMQNSPNSSPIVNRATDYPD